MYKKGLKTPQTYFSKGCRNTHELENMVLACFYGAGLQLYKRKDGDCSVD